MTEPARNAPPPIRRDPRQPITLIACGVVLAGLLIVVLLNIDTDEDPALARIAITADVTELVPPTELTAEELDASAAADRRGLDSAIAEMPSGGWIQISGKAGQLAQQYRFARLDPSPAGKGPGWIELTEPEFEVYGSGGSVIVLTGDSALAYRSESEVESGTLTGNVLIERFENVRDRTVDRRQDQPVLTVETSEASFDNIIGEVRCDDDLHMEMLSGEFDGHGLQLLLNDREDVIQSLSVETIERIRLAKRADASEPATPAPTPAASPVPTASDSTDGAPRVASSETLAPEPGANVTAPRDGAPASGTVPQDPEPEDETFYLLTLSDDVRIVQGTGDTRRTAYGDALRAIFTSASEGFGTAFALAAPSRSRASLASARGRTTGIEPRRQRWPGIEPRPQRWREFLTAAAFGQISIPRRLRIAPPPHPDDTIITCRGRLTVVPAEPVDRLPSIQDARLELVGTPVLLHDMAAEADATCSMLTWDIRRGRLELVGDVDHPLSITSPELEARADAFWLTQSDGLGGFSGAGAMTLVGNPDAAAPEHERVRITWREKVDLSFYGATAEDALGALRTAEFVGDVIVRSTDLALSDHTGARRSGATRGTGEMRTDALAVGFVPAGTQADGSSQITAEYMKARGAVMVADAEQTLWAASLDVWFLSPRASTAGPARDDAGPGSDVERIEADDDVRLLLPGGERVFADRLRVDAVARTAVLEGREVLLVDGNNVIDHAEHITIDDVRQRYVLEGRGRYRRFDRPVIAADARDPGPALVEQIEGRTEELRITWRHGVDIFPSGPARDAGDPGQDEASRPDLARFRGDVVVVSPELKLTHADEMTVKFASARAAERTPPTGDAGAGDELGAGIEWIEAHGDVHARSTGDPGAIRCDDLRVDLRENAEGQAIPERLVARNSVHLGNADQEIWAGELIVTFRERSREAAISDPEERGEFAGARVDVHEVRARNAVQVRLAGGERAFADSLFADGTNETAELLGDRVVVLGETFVLDRGTHLVLNRGTGQYRVQSAGVFLQFASPFDLPPTGAIPIPDLDGERTIEARWGESALYVANADGDGGSLELRGDVRAESRPNLYEFNTIEAASLTLDFIEVYPPNGDEPRKELARLAARGDARLENRTWPNLHERGAPRVFYVAGNLIEYDQRSLEALVIGDGELLIRDEWQRVDADANAGRGFGAKGTTLFRWQDTLHMTQEVDNRFNILMTGSVECLHRDLQNSPVTLTGERIEAIVERGGADGGPGAQAGARPGALDFGGPMTAKRLYGRGGIFVRTPDRDVACHEFDYNVMTGLAEMNAIPGSMVSILTRGAREPMHHERVLWDMHNDTITVYRGGGGVGK